MGDGDQGHSKNIVAATATIRGTKPLLWHHFGPDAIPLEKRERHGVAGNDPSEWCRTVLATKDGQLYLEPSYVFGCLRDAAKHTRKGRGSLQPLVAATLDVLDTRILVDRRLPDGLNDLAADPDEPVYLDIRGVVNPSNKARHVRYRVAASPGWRATFRIQWDTTVVSRAQMHAVLIDAGRLVGIGSGRVTGRGGIGMGRFEIERFEFGA